MKLAHPSCRRRGATLAESAIILIVFLILILGMFDVGTAVIRDNILPAAARQLSRQVIIHGQLAPAAKGDWTGPWGPGGKYPDKTPYVVNGAKDDHIANAVRPYLSGLDPAVVTIRVHWIDNGNAPGKRVLVSLDTPYYPISLLFVPSSGITLRASSTMPIAH